MLLLLAKEDVIPFILHSFNRKHRAKMNFSIWCPSSIPNTNLVVFVLMAAVRSLLCLALLLLAVFCLIELHSTALCCILQFCLQLSSRLLLVRGKRSCKSWPRVAYTWWAHCCQLKFVYVSCWVSSDQWPSHLMEEASSGVLVSTIF